MASTRITLGFKANDYSDAFDLAPYLPGRLGELGLFDERGVNRTHVDIEYRDNKLSLIETKERGSRDSTQTTTGKRRVYTFKIPHLPESAIIRPDDLPDVRAFGTKDGKVQVRQVVADHLRDMKQNFEATIEFHRMGAINGRIVNPSGDVIHDLFSIYEIAEEVIPVNLDSESQDYVKQAAFYVTRFVQDRLGVTPYRYIRVMCGDTFFDKVCFREETKLAFNRPRDGEFLRASQVRSSFEYAGIIWENYRGSVGGIDFINSNEARVVPVGVPGLFIRRNGPDDTMQGVGGRGKTITITEEWLPHGAGVELRAQMNPLILCTRPGVLARLTDSSSNGSS